MFGGTVVSNKQVPTKPQGYANCPRGFFDALLTYDDTMRLRFDRVHDDTMIKSLLFR